jgi:hypothetical protein
MERVESINQERERARERELTVGMEKRVVSKYFEL